MFYYTNLESVSPSLVVRIAIQHIYNNYKYIKQYKNDIPVMDGNNVAAAVEYLFFSKLTFKTYIEFNSFRWERATTT